MPLDFGTPGNLFLTNPEDNEWIGGDGQAKSNTLVETSPTDSSEYSQVGVTWDTKATIVLTPEVADNQVIFLTIYADMKVDAGDWEMRLTGDLATGTASSNNTTYDSIEASTFGTGAWIPKSAYTINFQIRADVPGNTAMAKNIKIKVTYLDNTKSEIESERWGAWT